jgi:hypothetical protein
MAFGNGPRIVTNGLLMSLDAADRNSYVSGSTTWFDLSGNNNSGSLINGPIFNTGSFGNIVFDGADDHINTSYSSSLSDFSLAVWFKSTDSTNAASARIIDKNFSTGFWTGKNTSGTANSWGGGVIQSGPPYGIFIPLNDGVWNYMVQVRQGTSYTLYGNGITNTTSTTIPSSILNSEKIFIGSTNNNLVGYYFKGSIGLVHLYNRALSPLEVLQNYNAQKSRFGL